MGADVGAYKTWRKEMKTYRRPKLTFQIRCSMDAITKASHAVDMSERIDFVESILFYGGYHEVMDYSEYVLRRYLNGAKKYKETIMSNPVYPGLKEELQDLLDAIDKGYAILRRHEGKGAERKMCFYAFNELEEYDREIWEYDDYVESAYPNSEIWNAFSKAEELFEIDLKKYVICTENPEYILDEHVNHNLADALAELEKVFQLNTDNVILYTPYMHSYKNGEHVSEVRPPVYLNTVLEEVKRLWSLGAKLEVTF